MPLSAPDLIFKQWETSLPTRDRSWPYVQSNFEELFETLKESGLEPAHAHDYVAKAVKAHSPDRGLIKFQYKKTKAINPRVGTEKEFEDNWIAGIASKANVAFFNVYPQQMVKKEPVAVAIVPKNIEQELSEFEAEDDSLTL
jgi:hypothetical protein